jgi:hypothetical protein
MDGARGIHFGSTFGQNLVHNQLDRRSDDDQPEDVRRVNLSNGIDTTMEQQPLPDSPGLLGESRGMKRTL